MNRKLIFTLLIALWTAPTASPAFDIEKMTLEEKVGQLLMVHFHGEYPNNDAEILVKEVHAGSIIYYRWSNGLHSPLQVSSLSAELQILTRLTHNRIPLIIAVDQEGGPVSRLKEGFTQMPPNKDVAATGDPETAFKYAYRTGQELRSVGINMNLAPVVDINSNPLNPVIGIRSYGDNPETVITFADKAIDGYHQTNILTSLKHFPGHGDVSTDSHHDLPVVKKSKDELLKTELRPFAALAAKADTVMTAHILVPSLDPDHCATTSKAILTILRDEIGFDSPIISDSLVMQGVLKECGSPEEAGIAALEAGCDILMFGGRVLIDEDSKVELTTADIKRIHRYLVDAVKSGRIKEERVDESVRRILTLKANLSN